MKKYLLYIVVTLFSVAGSAQTLYPNKFKTFFENKDVEKVPDKSFAKNLETLKTGETVRFFTKDDQKYHFIAKQSDSVAYELLAIKNTDDFECKKVVGKKLVFFRRFYFGNGWLVEDFGFSLEKPEMTASEYLCKGFGYCP